LNAENYAITLKNFFSKDLVSCIKALKSVRYDDEAKAWIVPISLKNEFCEIVCETCLKEGITLVDVPEFVTTMLNTKLPLKGKTKSKLDSSNE
jgi:hypothetical protein